MALVAHFLFGVSSMIVTNGLTKHYGAVRALTDLTLEIRRGEVFGLLGPNGSGKTTTAEFLAAVTNLLFIAHLNRSLEYSLPVPPPRPTPMMMTLSLCGWLQP